ncbi:MAG TPA: imidazole glycerol phosphate synthase subunit HisH [Thermoanaerobaculia bacterium]|jgi:glutamine amidotransferase
MDVTLIDSPVANTANIARALRVAGASLRITNDASAIANAEKLVLPGVGSFIAARTWLMETGVDEALRTAVARGSSLLGICVGHQLLFDVSHEMGTTRGLGFIAGAVERLEGMLPIPQIGWNRVVADANPLFDGLPPSTSFYFVNSYASRGTAHEVARADYDGPFTAAVQNGRVFGVQFHPEKSSTAGLQVLRNYVAWT